VGPSAGAWIGIHAVADQHPTHRWYDVLLYAVFAVGFFIWFVTLDAIASRSPSLSLRRQGRNRMLVYTPPRKSLRGKRDLRGRTERFATKLLEFLADCDRTSPFRGHPAWNEGWDKLSDEEKTRLWHEFTQGGVDHFGEQMNRFAVEYSIEALALFDEFRTRGLAKDDERHVFEHPTNTFGIREIAQKLGVWAKQL
jgi:hypothetical protein